jgi:hypothetical protein
MGQTLGRAPLPQGCKRFLNCILSFLPFPRFIFFFSLSSIFSLSELFSLVPRSCVYDLWEAFNDIAEGFGLTIEEFQEILKSALMEYLGVTERVLNTDTEKVFRIFDDDEVSAAIPCLCSHNLLQNNLVDSLEFLSSFALLSGMTPEEKIACTLSLSSLL